MDKKKYDNIYPEIVDRAKKVVLHDCPADISLEEQEDDVCAMFAQTQYDLTACKIVVEKSAMLDFDANIEASTLKKIRYIDEKIEKIGYSLFDQGGSNKKQQQNMARGVLLGYYASEMARSLVYDKEILLKDRLFFLDQVRRATIEECRRYRRE